MVDLRCRECGYQAPWEDIQASAVPSGEENVAKAVEGRAYTAKVVCPECGNDTFDRVETVPPDYHRLVEDGHMTESAYLSTDVNEVAQLYEEQYGQP